MPVRRVFFIFISLADSITPTLGSSRCLVYFDFWIYFADPSKSRGLHVISGIANSLGLLAAEYFADFAANASAI